MAALKASPAFGLSSYFYLTRFRKIMFHSIYVSLDFSLSLLPLTVLNLTFLHTRDERDARNME